MASVTFPVLAPAASADTGIPLAYLGVFMAFVYVGGMASTLASGDFILRYGPNALGFLTIRRSGD
jgi:hypothetical protein